jgi:hypothetical protein
MRHASLKSQVRGGETPEMIGMKDGSLQAVPLPEHSVAVLAARGWETLLGGALGLAAATLLFPLRLQERSC